MYSSYFGGSSADGALALAVSGEGEAVLGGVTLSEDLPTANALSDAFTPSDGGAGVADRTGFVTRLASDGLSLVHSTYLGGGNTGGAANAASFDEVTDLAVGNDGSTYVVGSTAWDDFPATGSLDGRQCLDGVAGGTDAFAAKFDPDGNLDWAYCFGGSASSEGLAIALDDVGNIYIAGTTLANDLVTVNAVQATAGGSVDSFLVKLNTHCHRDPLCHLLRRCRR